MTSFEDVELEFAHLVADAISLLDGCAMEYDPEKEKAVAASLEATAQES